MKDRTNKGIINETRALYDQLYGLAHRLTERDRQAARNRGPLAKALFVISFLAGMLAVATLVYGFITFPDAPIREAGNSYVGKQGAPHTREDYEWFKLWEMLMVASFGLAFLTGFGAVVAEKLSRRSKVTNNS